MTKQKQHNNFLVWTKDVKRELQHIKTLGYDIKIYYNSITKYYDIYLNDNFRNLYDPTQDVSNNKFYGLQDILNTIYRVLISR